MTSATQRARPSPHVGLPTPANVNKAPRLQQKPPEKYNPKLPLSVISRFIGRTLGAQIAPLIEATPTADATYDPGPYFWQNPDFDVSPELQNMSRGLLELPEVEIYTPSPSTGDWGSFKERPPLPEIPWRDFRPDVLGFSRSPKKGTLRINVPQYTVPIHYRLIMIRIMSYTKIQRCSRNCLLNCLKLAMILIIYRYHLKNSKVCLRLTKRVLL